MRREVVMMPAFENRRSTSAADMLMHRYLNCGCSFHQRSGSTLTYRVVARVLWRLVWLRSRGWAAGHVSFLLDLPVVVQVVCGVILRYELAMGVAQRVHVSSDRLGVGGSTGWK